MLPGSGSYPGWKGLEFGMEGASGSHFLSRVEGFRVWDGKVLPRSGSYPGWKGLGFGMEGASGPRFLPRVEGFRVWDGKVLPGVSRGNENKIPSLLSLHGFGACSV